MPTFRETDLLPMLLSSRDARLIEDELRGLAARVNTMAADFCARSVRHELGGHARDILATAAAVGRARMDARAQAAGYVRGEDRKWRSRRLPGQFFDELFDLDEHLSGFADGEEIDPIPAPPSLVDP